MIDQVWMEILCTAMTVTYATNPYVVLLLPKGTCQLCCPYHRDDIKLYVSVPGVVEEQYLDWENGSDWRILDNNRTTVFYIHGFTEQHTGPAATEIRKAYMERGEENLVVVDWAPLAAAPWYNQAVVNTHYVGQFLAGVIDSLVLRGLPLERVHVIGFSLGAEIAGFLAKSLTAGKLKRVTGLDPALPLFNPANPKGRLDKKDADFVDVIHTDGGIFGFDTPMGHADFFPNGGKPAQPGCRAEILVHTGRLNDFVACSHNRAWKYFAESVRDPLAFPAFHCHTFLEFEKGKCKKEQEGYMGYAADPKLRGKFFLETKATGPYGLGFHHGNVSVTYHVDTAPAVHELSGVQVVERPADAPVAVHQVVPVSQPDAPLHPVSPPASAYLDHSTGLSVTIGHPGTSLPEEYPVPSAGTGVAYSPAYSSASPAYPPDSPAYSPASPASHAYSPYYYQTGESYAQELFRSPMSQRSATYDTEARTLELLARRLGLDRLPDLRPDFAYPPPEIPYPLPGYGGLPFATRAEMSSSGLADPGSYVAGRLEPYRQVRTRSVFPPLVVRHVLIEKAAAGQGGLQKIPVLRLRRERFGRTAQRRSKAQRIRNARG